MIAAFRYCTLILCLLIALPVAASVSVPEDGHSGVILVYHRIGEDSSPESNLKTEQFLEHIAEIERGGYNVLALPALISALQKNEVLPPRTLAITFDGAFKSVLTNAIPALLEKKIPFTVFYSSDFADTDSGLYMSWADLKNLVSKETVTLGVLPATYARLASAENIRTQVNKARIRHREMLGGEASFFSYPYGEHSLNYKTIIKDSGFTAAFGQHSGAVASTSDFYTLPRFTMTEKYGDIDRFRTAAQALPFPVHDLEPQGSEYIPGKTSIGFSVPEALASSMKALSCFATGETNPEITILHERVELRLAEPVTEDRIRINCTLPAGVNPENDTPLWRWLGMLLVNSAAIEAPANEPIQPPTGLP
jgi:peptidoglycan/xylan/chitin deacetylase (PgdA/CDA1 family)